MVKLKNQPNIDYIKFSLRTVGDPTISHKLVMRLYIIGEPDYKQRALNIPDKLAIQLCNLLSRCRIYSQEI